MLMQKIEVPAVSCNLFDTVKGWTGTGTSSNAPRAAGEAEARAYADFIRRKNNLPEIGKPQLHHTGYCRGQAPGAHFHYVGATFGAAIQGPTRDVATGKAIPAQYEPGAYSVLFPGANMMRATVTMETLNDAGEVTASQTMPVEPKKGGAIWSKDDVRKACGPIAKPEKAKRAPTRIKRGPIPVQSGADAEKRRRVVLLALKLRAELRRMRAEARQVPEDCAEAVTATDAPATVPDAILSDLAAAERLMRGEGYVAPTAIYADAIPIPVQSKRTPAHERAIRRAWAERKARRMAQGANDAERVRANEAVREASKHRGWWEAISRDAAAICAERDALAYKRRRALLAAREARRTARYFIKQAGAHHDRAINAEHEARTALAMREDLKRILADAEQRLAAAEAENAQLWREIETLTAPQPALAA